MRTPPRRLTTGDSGSGTREGTPPSSPNLASTTSGYSSLTGFEDHYPYQLSGGMQQRARSRPGAGGQPPRAADGRAFRVDRRPDPRTAAVRTLAHLGLPSVVPGERGAHAQAHDADSNGHPSPLPALLAAWAAEDCQEGLIRAAVGSRTTSGVQPCACRQVVRSTECVP